MLRTTLVGEVYNTKLVNLGACVPRAFGNPSTGCMPAVSQALKTGGTTIASEVRRHMHGE